MSVAYVEEAAGWAHELTLAESRGPGDYDNAMRRVSKSIGVAYSALWALRYRKPKRLWADIYEPLKSAFHELTTGERLADRYANIVSTNDRRRAALVSHSNRYRNRPDVAVG